MPQKPPAPEIPVYLDGDHEQGRLNKVSILQYDANNNFAGLRVSNADEFLQLAKQVDTVCFQLTSLQRHLSNEHLINVLLLIDEFALTASLLRGVADRCLVWAQPVQMVVLRLSILHSSITKSLTCFWDHWSDHGLSERRRWRKYRRAMNGSGLSMSICFPLYILFLESLSLEMTR